MPASRRTLVVAGQHDDPDAHLLKGADGGRAAFLHHIGNQNHADHPAVGSEEEGRFALLCRLRRRSLKRREVNPARLHKPTVSAKQSLTLRPAVDPAARLYAEILRRGRLNALLRSIGGYGRRKRVLRPPLQPGRKAEKHLLRNAVGRKKAGNRRPSDREGSGFVKQDGVHLVRDLQTLARFDEDAVFRPFSGAHHDGGRRREAERTGAGDYQHRNADRQCKVEGLADQHP